MSALPTYTPPLVETQGVHAPDATYRWDVDWGTATLTDGVYFYFKGFPPLPGETMAAYLARASAIYSIFAGFGYPQIYRVKWWQFWREKRPAHG